jgi:hypothetical protein
MRVSTKIAWLVLLTASGAALGDRTGAAGSNTVVSVVAAPSGVAPTVAPAPVTLAPSLSGTVPFADEVVVRKSERRLYLLRHGEVLRSYRVALGLIPGRTLPAHAP